MIIEHNLIFKNLTDILSTAINASFPEIKLNRAEIYSNIGSTPNIEVGHFSFPCFFLAKLLKISPVNIAKKLILEISSLLDQEKVTLEGPYLNFKIHSQSYGEDLLASILNNDFFTRILSKDSFKTMIEYSQPNTHKEMHIGHMRNLSLGNALVQIKKYCNQEVISATYPGDSGTHVAKCLWYLKYHNKEEFPKENRGEWLGKIYCLANSKFKDEDEAGRDKNRQQLTDILSELYNQEGEFFNLWKETREWSIDLMKKSYKWASVNFDRWFFESEVDAASIKLGLDYYKKGLFIKDKGAICIDLNSENLGFCILIKSDGTGLYSIKDIALASLKFREFKIEKNFYIVDSRQSHHFKQIFKILDKIDKENSKNCYHIPYEMVELPNGPMSSRAGNIIPLTDLILKMENTIIENYLEKYRGDWPDEEISKTSTIIANAAIKYGMVKMDNNRKIIFNMNEWLKLDGETGPYLQYIYARINSLLKKLEYSAAEEVNFSLLIESQEVSLMQKLSLFNDIILKSHEQNKTNLITTYLYELGKLFNQFYASFSIAKSEKGLKKSRLMLAHATSKTIKEGLSLLGISCPERM